MFVVAVPFVTVPWHFEPMKGIAEMEKINRLFELRDKAERLRIDLNILAGKEQPTYVSKIRDEIALLDDELNNSKIPEYFRVAIVGTFKTGKSSFVNKLAGVGLAGVETNPETAAISIFRYSDHPKAEVCLISSEEWSRMEDLYEDAPKHPEAYRVAGLREFNDDMAKRKYKAGRPISFTRIDPDVMVKKWLKD